MAFSCIEISGNYSPSLEKCKFTFFRLNVFHFNGIGSNYLVNSLVMLFAKLLHKRVDSALELGGAQGPPLLFFIRASRCTRFHLKNIPVIGIVHFLSITAIAVDYFISSLHFEVIVVLDCVRTVILALVLGYIT
jgi:hypothetical protein